MNIRTLLQQNELTPGQTAYFDQDDAYLDYPLFRLGTVGVTSVSKHLADFPSLEAIQKESQRLDNRNGIVKYESELKTCQERIMSFKRSHGKNPLFYEAEQKDQYGALVRLRKSLSQKIKTLRQEGRQTILQQYKVSNIEELKCLVIRGIGMCNTRSNITKIMPQLSNCTVMAENVPIFTHGLTAFKRRMEKEVSAVEGGPCLIGVDELYLNLQFRNGASNNYDFITGQEDGPENEYMPSSYPLASVISEARSEIVHIDVVEKQHGPTLQHLTELRSMMLICKALDLRLVIGLPDHAYKCHLRSILSPLNGRFDVVIDRIEASISEIADEFVRMIKKVASELGFNNFEILHSRNEPMMQCLLKARNEAGERSKEVRVSRYREDAVIDYVCMPALPYYVWGATNVLEVNNVAEFESIKITKRLFPHVEVGAVMFPFVPNRSTTDSMYHSKNDEKVFVGDTWASSGA